LIGSDTIVCLPRQRLRLRSFANTLRGETEKTL
jgi:hypothetical protein